MAKATSTRKRKPKATSSSALETLGTGSSQSAGALSSTVYGTQPSQENIKRRAYEFFIARGGIHGNDQEDWFQAERELGAAGRLAS